MKTTSLGSELNNAVMERTQLLLPRLEQLKSALDKERITLVAQRQRLDAIGATLEQTKFRLNAAGDSTQSNVNGNHGREGPSLN